MATPTSTVAMRHSSLLPSGRHGALPSSTKCGTLRSAPCTPGGPAITHKTIAMPCRAPCRLPGAAPRRRRQTPPPARVASPEAPAAAPPAPAVNQHLVPSGQPACEAFGEPLCGRPDPLGATIDPDNVRGHRLRYAHAASCLFAAGCQVCLFCMAVTIRSPPAALQGATNFAVYASNAWGMSLCLFTEADLRAGRVTHEVALHPQASAAPDWLVCYCGLRFICSSSA